MRVREHDSADRVRSPAARRSGRPPLRWAVALIVVGALLSIGAFVYGSLAYGSLAKDLRAVPLGTQLTFRPSGSYRADIFITHPSPASGPPTCSVATTGGRAVLVEDASLYLVSQERHMQTDYGFDLSADTTYLVTCGSRGNTGEFAVVEVPILPRVVATILMVPGVLAIVAGLVLVVIARRRERRTRRV